MDESHGRKELRLAVVCYGGVSLCIYMHGITKELHRLVRASQQTDPAPGASTENVYREVLARAAQEGRGYGSVVIDVIAGTSAGGINGVYLAKALAHNLRQDVLRDLWMDRGDIGGLVRGPKWLPMSLRAAAMLVRKRAPLDGDQMCRWLYEALVAMDGTQVGRASLLPGAHGLQLFVTMTDLKGFERRLVLYDPRVAWDRYHRHVFEFCYGDGRDDFTPEHNPALAFAARATSSFPGAFPPISADGLRRILPPGSGEIQPGFFRVYDLAGTAPARRFFVDGGVLDNRPFGRAVDAIRAKRAGVQVNRKLVFIEPDPKSPESDAAGDRSVPDPLPTVAASVLKVPRQQTIVNEVLEIQRLNERVERMRDVVEGSFDAVRARVAGIVGDEPAPDFETISGWQRTVHAVAIQNAERSYPTYLRAKIDDVVDALAETFCAVCDFPPDTDHAFLVRATVRAWARGRGLFDCSDAPTTEQVAFLAAFDLDYGMRRLLFVIAGVNWLYGREGSPPFSELDWFKDFLWSRVDLLRRTRSGAGVDDSVVQAFFPEKVVGAHLDAIGFDGWCAGGLDGLVDAVEAFYDLQLDAFSSDLYKGVAEHTVGWEPATRYDLMVRYLGFPLWDVLTYPLHAAGSAGECDNVDVWRVSPLDTHLLQGETLEGIGMAHFRAFFKREFRENDYLWGRLDGAERLISLVLGKQHRDFKKWCGRAFLAILDEETPALTTIDELIEGLRSQAKALADGEV